MSCRTDRGRADGPDRKSRLQPRGPRRRRARLAVCMCVLITAIAGCGTQSPPTGLRVVGTTQVLRVADGEGVNGLVSDQHGGVWFWRSTDPPTLYHASPDGPLTGAAIDGVASPLAAGPDGSVWFAGGQGSNVVEHRDISGHLQRVAVPGLTYADDLVVDGRGRAWIAGSTASGTTAAYWVDELSPDGSRLRHPLPSSRIRPRMLAAGTNGDLWYVASTMSGSADAVERIAADSTIVEVPVPAVSAVWPMPDGGVAFWGIRSQPFDVAGTRGVVGRVDVSGQVTTHQLARSHHVPGLIAFDCSVFTTQERIACAEELDIEKSAPSPWEGPFDVIQAQLDGTVTTTTLPDKTYAIGVARYGTDSLMIVESTGTLARIASDGTLAEIPGGGVPVPASRAPLASTAHDVVVTTDNGPIWVYSDEERTLLRVDLGG